MRRDVLLVSVSGTDAVPGRVAEKKVEKFFELFEL